LHYCSSCGLGQICDPIDPETLYKGYNYCFSSWKIQPHVPSEVETILSYAKNGPALEIAANDGLFLEELRKNNFGPLVGIEPNPFASEITRKKGFPVYSKMLDPTVCKKAVEEYGKFEVVIARQVLEHLPDINNFFDCTDLLLKNDGLLFVDIPDISEENLSMGDCSFIWEEHTNYFTDAVFENTLKIFHYSPLSAKKYGFSNSTSAILARKTDSFLDQGQLSETLEEKVQNFRFKAKEFENLFKSTVGSLREKGHKVILYGVGGRVCTVVNGLKLGSYIDFIIDDQIERQGKFMPGARLPIVDPSSIYGSRDPIICLLAVNQENEEQVKARLNKNIGNNAKFQRLCRIASSNIIFLFITRINLNSHIR
jgi:SAM-dependent methyltransferase